MEPPPTRRQSARTRPKPKPVSRPAASDPEDSAEALTEPEPEEDAPPEEDEIEEYAEQQAEAPVTPQPLRTYGSRTNGSSSQVSSALKALSGSSSSPSKKRRRGEVEDEEMIKNDDEGTGADGDISPGTQESEMPDMVIKRRRVRR